MATLLKGDCLKVMATLPDKSVDCFICDLPYGQLHAGRKELDKGKWWDRPVNGCGWDVKIDLVEFWKQVKRLCKNEHTPVLMFCNTRFGIDLLNSNPKWFRHDLVWDKGHGVSFLSANKMPMKSHEMIYVFSKAGAYYKRINIKTDKKVWVRDRAKEVRPTSVQYGVEKRDTVDSGGKDGMRCPLSVIPVHGKSAGGHPTEKPKELYEWLLSRYCPEGGTVLDPTAGSFNSILVARKLGFRAIGIEMDTNFYWKGVAKFA
jgi:site-specific DNA-methyltransferase (adenine-specific)